MPRNRGPKLEDYAVRSRREGPAFPYPYPLAATLLLNSFSINSTLSSLSSALNLSSSDSGVNTSLAAAFSADGHMDLALHAPDRVLLIVAHDVLRLRGAANHLRPAMLRDQHLAMRARLRQLLLQLVQSLPQIVRLVLLVLGLRGESDCQLVLAQCTLQRGTSQIVLALLYRQLGLAPPLCTPAARARPSSFPADADPQSQSPPVSSPA